MSEAWEWWAGRNEEHYECGPFATREDAIAEGESYFDGDGFFIIEAQRPAVKLDAERLLDDQYFEHDDLFDFEYSEPSREGSKADIEEADAALQALLDQWVEDWSHTFTPPSLFSCSRAREWIEGKDPSDG